MRAQRSFSWILVAALAAAGAWALQSSWAGRVPPALPLGKAQHQGPRVVEELVGIERQAVRIAVTEPGPKRAPAPVRTAERAERIEVHVVQTDGSGVSARVSLHGPNAIVRSADGLPDVRGAREVRFTDAYGDARFDLAPAGSYTLLVDEFVDHLAPPATIPHLSVRSDQTAFMDELTVGEDAHERTFVLSIAAWIEGRVRDDRGRAIEGAVVCATLQDPTDRSSVYAETDAGGHFRLRCTPGRQRVNLFLGEGHAWSDAVRPIPRTLDLHPRDAQVADFVLSRSGARVTGRVLDQDGRPMGDLEVLCYYKPDQSQLPEEQRSHFTLRDHARSVRTASDGRFEVLGLPAERYGIQVGPEDYQPVGQGRLGMLVPRRIADLRQADHADLGTIGVVRSRPFWLHGRVAQPEVLEERADSEDLELFAVLQPGERRARVHEERIPIRRQNSGLVFEWSCETPEDPVLLELRGPRGVLVQAIVHPLPGENGQALLAIPRSQ